jgi:aspartyl-tRNA(Asn)/glutamyl-tRNA(Gln) amidotransferase subunit A
MRFGVPEEFISEGLSGDVRDAFLKVLDDLRAHGAEVEFFSLKTTEYMIPAYYIIASAEASSNLERFDGVKYGYRADSYNGLHDMYKETRTQGFGEEVKRRIMLGSFVLSSGYYDAYYLKALKTKALIKGEFDRAFASYDVLLAPAAPYTAPKIGESLKDPLAMYLGDIDTVAVNLCGLPGISVPCGLDPAGLPIGIQMIGDCYKEANILRAARAYESWRGPFAKPGKEAACHETV